MAYKLTRKDEKWIMKGIEKQMTKLQMRKKLLEAGYDEEKIDEFAKYFEANLPKEELIKNEKEEKKFEGNVRKYFDENRKDLSWGERRQVRNFIKQAERYSAIVKKAIEGFRKEIEFINKQEWAKGKIEKEMEYLKDEIIDRLLESKAILEIEHPITGEEITKDNLKSLEMDMLIGLMQEATNSLDMLVNGKVVD